MKYTINISEGVLRLPPVIRILVTIFLPWIALWAARRQLRIACLIIRNEARCMTPESTTLIRWADECEQDGNMKE